MSLAYASTLESHATFPFSAAAINDSGLLVVGSRFGALAVYAIADDASSKKSVGCWRRIMSEDCITNVIVTHEEPDLTDVLITSRTGVYSVCSVVEEDKKVILQKIHLNRVAKGSIEGVSCQLSVRVCSLLLTFVKGHIHRRRFDSLGIQK